MHEISHYNKPKDKINERLHAKVLGESELRFNLDFLTLNLGYGGEKLESMAKRKYDPTADSDFIVETGVYNKEERDKEELGTREEFIEKYPEFKTEMAKMDASAAEDNLKSLKKMKDYCEENDIMMIHISGAVKNPGVIEIKKGYRLIDVIELSGGLLEDANDDNINLAKRLSDEEKIYIPFIGEEISHMDGSTEENNSQVKININSCTKEELMTLPGIGDVTADKILNYREEKAFNKIEDIMSVSGIGEKKFEAIESLIITN